MEAEQFDINNLDKDKKRNIIIAITAIVIVGAGFYLLSGGDNYSQPSPSDSSDAGKDAGYKPLPLPEVQTKERRFEVLSVVKEGAYRVRDSASKKETDLFIPDDAEFADGSIKEIKNGSVITAQKYMEVSNGIVAVKLNAD